MRKIKLILKTLYARFISKIPLIVAWEITNKCQSKCLYCDYWKPSDNNQLNTSNIKKIIDDLYMMGTEIIHFTGGEPLLRPDIFEILKYAHEKGFKISLNSNGLLIPANFNKIKKYISLLNLSLDGDKDIHDKIRGVPSFDKVIESIKLAKNAGITVRLVSVLSKLNFQNIDKILEVTKILGCSTYFQAAYPKKFVSSLNNPLALSNYEYDMVMDKIIYCKKNKYSKYIGNSVSGLLFMKNKEQHKKINCYLQNISVRIGYQGELYPCGIHKYNKTFNCKVMGFKKAYELSDINFYCDNCWCSNRIEANILLSFDLKQILSYLFGDLL